MIRKGALPRRFFNSGGIEVFSEKTEKIMIYGRDEMEAMYLCPETVFCRQEFIQMVERQTAKEARGGSYVTAVISTEAVTLSGLSERVRELYEALNRRIMVGKTQIFRWDAPEPARKTNAGEAADLKALGVYLEHGDMEALSKAVGKALQKWISCEYPQLRLEKLVRQVFYLLLGAGISKLSEEECEFLLEDAFCHAQTAAELSESVAGIIGLMTGGGKEEPVRTDSEEFFLRVSEYIREHAAEPLTLSRMCRQFGVSQTYLSRLFRKYGDTSFVHYLTRVRMEAAKTLMKENPGLFIRDIAEMTGYGDQFYFSRIFRSVTGESPSEYMEHVASENGKI